MSVFDEDVYMFWRTPEAWARGADGLLAANEPDSWEDEDGWRWDTPKGSGRLSFSGCSLHRRLRDFVIKRDRNTCVRCGDRADEVTLRIDHIVSRRNGGSHHPDNLQTLCNHCNVVKSNLIDSERLIPTWLQQRTVRP